MSARSRPVAPVPVPVPHHQLPPQNLEAERSVLGGILLDNAKLKIVSGFLQPADFYREAHRKVFEAMLSLDNDGTTIDVITLRDELKHRHADAREDGEDLLNMLALCGTSPTEAIEHHGRIILAKAVLRGTIEAAHAIAAQGYEQHGDSAAFLEEARRKIETATSRLSGDGLAAPKGALATRRITIGRVRSPPAEQFLVGVLFPFGKPSVLYGPQGTGKSAFLSQLVFEVAAGGGGSFLGMFMHDQEGGPVLVYTAEDTFEDWERKAAAILRAFPDVNMERALGRIDIADKNEGEGRLTESVQLREDVGNGGSVIRPSRRPTPERLAVIQRAKALGARMIAIETASRLVDKEANEDFSALLSACGHIAAETGAAVILSHHPTKAASKDNDSSPEGVRGGGAFINNSRCAVSLFPADASTVTSLQAKGLQFPGEDVLLLEHQKGTSSVRKQQPIVLVRCSTPFGGVLQTPELASANPEQAREAADRAERKARQIDYQRSKLCVVVERLREVGPVSANKLRPHGPEFGVPKRDVDAFVDAAIQDGVLVPLRRDRIGRILALGLPQQPPSEPQRATPRDFHETEA